MGKFTPGAIFSLVVTACSAVAGTNEVVNSCSNVNFLYLGTDPGISAMCLRSDGTPNKTSTLISGVTNRDGILTLSRGPSTFQRTCGSIRILQLGDALILHARCRNLAGRAQPSSIELRGLSNQNGVLTN